MKETMKIKKINLKIIVAVLLLFFLTISVSAETYHYYNIDLRYKEGNLSYQKIAVQPSPEKLQTPEGTYIAELVSFDNKILNFTFFAIPVTILYDNFNPETGEIIGGGMIEINETDVALYVPYYINAKEINLYDKDLIKKLTIDVSSFAKETAVEKPTGKKKEERGEAEIPEITGKEMVTEPKPVLKIIEGVSIGIAIIIALILIIILFKKKRPTEPNQ